MSEPKRYRCGSADAYENELSRLEAELKQAREVHKRWCTEFSLKFTDLQEERDQLKLELEEANKKAEFFKSQFDAKALRNGENIIARDRFENAAGTWMNGFADKAQECAKLRSELAACQKERDDWKHACGVNAESSGRLTAACDLAERELAASRAEVERLKAAIIEEHNRYMPTCDCNLCQALQPKADEGER